MNKVLALAAALAAAAPALAKDALGSANTSPIILGMGDAKAAKMPSLRVSGSWKLAAPDRDFGGASALILRNKNLSILTDAGRIFDIEDGLPVRSRALPAPCARPGGKSKADAEAMTLSPDGTGFRVALERVNMVCSWRLDSPNDAMLIPVNAMQGWKRNRGAEAMASLAGQGVLIIAEGMMDRAGLRPALWFHGDPARAETQVTKMHYQAPEGYKPGDAAFLPDGRLIVLNRRTKFGKAASTILTIHPAIDLKADMVLAGRELTRLSGQGVAANYEGMAIEAHTGGATLWLISDNNFRGRVETRLLRLDWVE